MIYLEHVDDDEVIYKITSEDWAQHYVTFCKKGFKRTILYSPADEYISTGGNIYLKNGHSSIICLKTTAKALLNLDTEPKICDNSSEIGVKYDSDKPMMELLPPLAIVEVAKVLTYGAHKYSPDNWRRVENLQGRYTGAALRHIFKEMSGEMFDDETSISHMAHAICCLLFKLEDKLLDGKGKEEGIREPKSSESGEGSGFIDPYGWK